MLLLVAEVLLYVHKKTVGLLGTGDAPASSSLAVCTLLGAEWTQNRSAVTFHHGVVQVVQVVQVLPWL